jgi:hypothetical protein
MRFFAPLGEMSRSDRGVQLGETEFPFRGDVAKRQRGAFPKVKLSYDFIASVTVLNFPFRMLNIYK